ncbi:hypothetical protein QFZ91_005307 [Paraburkholderia sp. JPY419]
MNINTDAIDEVALALLYLTLHDRYRAWKGFDWDVLNRLYERGFIEEPGQQDEVCDLYRRRTARVRAAL